MLQCFLFLTFFCLWDIFLAVRTSIYQVTLPICSCMLCILSISTLNIYIFTTKMFISHSHLYPLQAIGGTSLLYLNQGLRLKELSLCGMLLVLCEREKIKWDESPNEWLLVNSILRSGTCYFYSFGKSVESISSVEWKCVFLCNP